MKKFQFPGSFGLRVSTFVMNHRLILPNWKVLCLLVALQCWIPVCSAADSLIGKWRAIDETNTIHGFAYIPELKFQEDGTLNAGIKYGYRIIDDGKFVWQIGYGIEKTYKYQIWDDLLLIYSLEAPDDRARFKRVK